MCGRREQRYVRSVGKWGCFFDLRQDIFLTHTFLLTHTLNSLPRSSQQSKLVSDEVQRQHRPWMETLYSDEADRAEADKLRNAMQRHREAKQRKNVAVRSTAAETHADDKEEGAWREPSSKLDPEEEAVLAQIRAGRGTSSHATKGRMASLTSAQIREQRNTLLGQKTSDVTGGEDQFDKAFLAEMHSQKLAVERQEKRKMLRERRSIRADQSLGLRGGDVALKSQDGIGGAAADWSKEGPWTRKGEESGLGAESRMSSFFSSAKGKSRGGKKDSNDGFEEVRASVVEDTGDDAVRAYEAAAAKAQLAKERLDARRLSGNSASLVNLPPKSQPALTSKAHHGRSGKNPSMRPSLSAEATQQLHAQLDSQKFSHDDRDDEKSRRSDKGGGSRSKSRGRESRGRSGSRASRRGSSSKEETGGSRRGRMAGGMDQEPRSGRSSSRPTKSTEKIDVRVCHCCWSLNISPSSTAHFTFFLVFVSVLSGYGWSWWRRRAARRPLSSPS